MPAPNDLRDKQRAEIKPLIKALKKAFAGKTRIAIADQSGLTNYQVGRILGEYLPAPTYLDITKLILASGMSPDEAAHIIGLYEGNPVSTEQRKLEQAVYERRILHLLRNNNLTATQLNLLTQVIEATVRGLEGHDLLDASEEDVSHDDDEEVPAVRADGDVDLDCP